MQIMQFLFYQDMEIVSTGNDLFDVLLSLFILGSSTFAKSWCGCHFSQTWNWVQNPSLGGSVGCTSKLHIPVHIFLAGGGEGGWHDFCFTSFTTGVTSHHWLYTKCLLCSLAHVLIASSCFCHFSPFIYVYIDDRWFAEPAADDSHSEVWLWSY